MSGVSVSASTLTSIKSDARAALSAATDTRTRIGNCEVNVRDCIGRIEGVESVLQRTFIGRLRWLVVGR